MTVLNIDNKKIYFEHCSTGVDLNYDIIRPMGFVHDDRYGSDIQLKLWGQGEVYFLKHGMDYHYINGYNRLIVIGVDEL